MASDRHRMTLRLFPGATLVARLAAGLLLCGAGARGAQPNAPSANVPYAAQIEAEWQRHDEERLIQVRQPGLVRFATGTLDWPGLSPQSERAENGLRVSRLASPKIDGRLDDPCWAQAARLPAGAADQPVQPLLKIGHDDGRVLLGATFPTASEACFFPASTAVDASGAVDGVKNGRYAFHTGLEPNPWWQVDLGVRRAVGSIVVYNRLDYAPGLHNADHLVILASDDGQNWQTCHTNGGKHFGGADGKPLVVDFPAPGTQGKQPLQTRYVRIQIPSPAPIFLHLDEVEVYAPGDRQNNLALGRPADQSSMSPWSRGGSLATLDASKIGLAPGAGGPVVTLDGKPLPADRAALTRRNGQTELEIALPFAGVGEAFPSVITPFHGRAIPLAAAGAWRIVWPEPLRLGFGRNRLVLRLVADEPLRQPVRVAVETVVFTPQRAERQTVCQRELASPAELPLEFSIAHEGAAAVIVSASQGGRTAREGRAFFIAPVEETLHRAERLAAEFALPAPHDLAAMRERVAACSAREQAAATEPEARHALYREARWLARRAAFSNPALPRQILCVKRFTQETYPDVCLNHMPWVSRPGGDLAVLTLAGPDRAAQVRHVLQGALGPGHVHGMDLEFDADRIVFGYAKARSVEPPQGWLNRATSFDLRNREEPTHLFEIGLDGRNLRQLTQGEWSDLDPTYLPNGDICFVSERCGYSLQCNEYDKDETSTNLYVMRPDGSQIRRLSVTKDGDYLPHTLDDGTIGYTRWEYQERGWAHIQSLWTIRPDGTGADSLFKQHFNDPWAVEDCRSLPGSHRFVGVATGHHTLPAGPVILINPRDGMNSPKGIAIVTPGVLPPEGGMSGHAVPEGGVMGASGYYMNPWPLSSSTMLTSYGAHGHAAGVAHEIDPTGYALYLIDVYGTKELVYRDPAISCFSPIPLRPRTRPPILADLTRPRVPYAFLSVQDVAKGAPGIDPARVKFLRIAEGVAWPYSNAEGGHRYEPDVKSVMINWNPVRVIGDVPVEADGSAHFRVPVDRPLYFQLLDGDRMELRRMRSFISFQPGEVRGCVGCHETRAEAGTAGRYSMALAREPSIPAPPPWGDRPISFLRDVQPVFDNRCTGCHGGLKPAAGLDFSAGLTARHNRAYDTILAHKLVAWSNVGDDARITMPLAFGSHRSKLVEVLRTGPCASRARLSDDDWRRLVTWIDANAPYHDGFLNKRAAAAPYDLPADRALGEKIAAVHARRCAPCHEAAAVSRLDWIDLGRPRASRFLAAPLAKAQGGSGKCPTPPYASTDDPDYRALSALVEAAAHKAWQLPRRDLKALLPAPLVAAQKR